MKLTTCLRIFPYCANSCSINDVAAGGKLSATYNRWHAIA